MLMLALSRVHLTPRYAPVVRHFRDNRRLRQDRRQLRVLRMKESGVGALALLMAQLGI